VRRWFS